MKHVITKHSILGYIHRFVNACLITISIILYIVFICLRDNQMAEYISKSLLSILVVLVFFNLAMIMSDIIPRARINKKLQSFFLQENYNAARKYLCKLRSKVVMPSIYQMLLYYSGYVELLENELENGKMFLTQFEKDKQFRLNSYFLAYSIFMLYFIFVYEGDNEELVSIRNIFNKQKAAILKVANSNMEVHLAFTAIDYFESNATIEGVNCLQHSQFYKLPFLKQLASKCKLNLQGGI